MNEENYINRHEYEATIKHLEKSIDELKVNIVSLTSIVQSLKDEQSNNRLTTIKLIIGYIVSFASGVLVVEFSKLIH
jgi:hypothetical protein